MKFFTRSFLIFISILGISSDTVAQFQTGDVFVAVANGSVQWRRPTGTLVQTLNGGLGGFTTGMAFDSAQSLYVTNFSNSVVHRFDKNGVQISNFGSGYSTPECIVFDGSWNAYVGNIGGGFRKYDATGAFLGTVAGGTRIDFANLQADQSIMLYTQEGTRIGRWDVVNNVALTDFATGLGGNAYDLRIRNNGDVLLANGANILRLSSVGAILQTYDVTGQNSWFALNLDPDGTSFWSADLSTSNVYRIDIATGNVISTFNTGTGNGTVFGLTVAGEINVATQFVINNPSPYTKWISGETSTIQWTGWTNVNIKCILNFGTALQTEEIIATNIFLTQTEYPWTIPDETLSYQSKIVIENAANPTQKIESGIFRIKPYLLTRVNPDMTYYEFKKNRDQWGFWNQQSQMWPESWYEQFNYLTAIDPFTNMSYSLTQGLGTFLRAQSKDHPDWISWVNTFTTDLCYLSLSRGIYSPTALERWRFHKGRYIGACFGIATANAIVFANKDEFFVKYPTFTSFNNPIDVDTSDIVKKTINELHTHQMGQPHTNYKINAGLTKFPNQTLNDIKTMLKEDEPLKILWIIKNTGRVAAHTVNVYKVIQDILNKNLYNIYIYDNLFPDSTNPIVIDKLGNNGNGTWSYSNLPGWGGKEYIFLIDPAISYLLNPIFDNSIEKKSDFILNDTLLQIFNSESNDILIENNIGNKTGYFNDTLYLNIPNSFPELIPGGIEAPPIGYNLKADNYSIILNNFKKDTTHAGFFTGNKFFAYERFNASATQTDKLYFIEGLSISNSDPDIKTISLRNIQNEATSEKLFALSSLEMAQNDSVKIENLGSENFKLISFGSTKNYDIELNFASKTELGRFVNVNIDLPSNSSHTFLPDWNNVTTSQLVILEDIGNNGTIDDTLRINNIITNLEEGLLSMPDRYSLAQNYPNPFNPSTLIKYNIKSDGLVTLKVYDVLGKEVATLVNELKQSGRYEVEFNGSNLGSGIYYYRLHAGEYSETRKMLLLK